MVTCHCCGGEDFEKHEGFMYCSTCQTQSQDYYEQEYDFENHEVNVSRRIPKPPRKSKEQKVQDDGSWTTWEAFNYILYGMTEELKKCGADEKFGRVVLKLWASYLQKCNIAFVSKSEAKIPKLSFGFRKRDAKILYDIEVPSTSKKRPYRSRSCSASSTSNPLLQSKRSISLQKGKIIAAEYEEYLVSSSQATTSLLDETLESLGKYSIDETKDSSATGDELLKRLKDTLPPKDYRLYKRLHTSKSSMKAANNKSEINIRRLAKNKLLALINLALLLTCSKIQLGDLLRFIRGGHLSYAKVTQFFPKEIKLPKTDVTYLEVTLDHIMPSHLSQRKISGKLARFLGVKQIPTPNIGALINRYCLDLNLPKQVADFGRKLTENCIPKSTEPGLKTYEPNYEAWAMASIILTLKLHFGINGKTEIFLSRLALEVNKLGNSEVSLFVFKDWQKFIECRKTVLISFHYPTEEQLGGTPFQSSKNFIDTLRKESKDEHREDRFIRYPRYYIEEGFLNGVKDALNNLTRTQHVDCFDFKPSLTPQVSNLKTIMRGLSQGEKIDGEGKKSSRPEVTLPENILRQDFRNCDIKFALDPKSCLNSLNENSDLCTEFGINEEPEAGEKEDLEFLLNCSSRYWILRLPQKRVCSLQQFNSEVLSKTPQNFQWLVTECARMLEMNIRDLYEELLRFEVMLRCERSEKSSKKKASRAIE